MVLAYWTWGLLSPSSEPRIQTVLAVTDFGDSSEAAHRLFGNVAQGNSQAAAGASGIALLGVIAAPGTQSGYAVMRLDAKRTVAVREGEEIEPGVRVLEVHADHVVLERSGQRETLAWVVQGQGRLQGKGAEPKTPGARN